MKLRRILVETFAILCLPLLFFAALIYRFRKKPVDVGLGPEPLINNIYHKQALRRYGYTAETFVGQVYFITDDFDVRMDVLFSAQGRLRLLRPFWFLKYIYIFLYTIRRYRCLYIYFHGGPLGIWSRSLQRWEPWLYHLAGVKLVVMPYGDRKSVV